MEKSELIDELLAKELELIADVQGQLGDAPDAGPLNRLSTAFVGLTHALREKFQEQTREGMARIISELGQGKDVSPEDVELIRTWMVGDASSYVDNENDLHSWSEELKRLLGEILEARGRQLQPAELVALKGKVRDAQRTAADIQFYREQEERVQNFENATRTWEADQKRLMARLLEQKLRSGEF